MASQPASQPASPAARPQARCLVATWLLAAVRQHGLSGLLEGLQRPFTALLGAVGAMSTASAAVHRALAPETQLSIVPGLCVEALEQLTQSNFAASDVPVDATIKLQSRFVGVLVAALQRAAATDDATGMSNVLRASDMQTQRMISATGGAFLPQSLQQRLQQLSRPLRAAG